MKKVVSGIVLTMLLGAAGATSLETAQLEPIVRAALRNNHVPGVAIGVLVDGNLVFQAVYGMANDETQTPITTNTHFEIGSMTKQFTAAAILQLKEQGKLKLSDPLGKYVPEYALGKNITIEELLWQVSGIPDYLNDVPMQNVIQIIIRHPEGGLNNELDVIKGMPLSFAPGTQWRYSNTNYLLLGTIIERVSQMQWEQYIRRNIFARAGMTQSEFIGDEPQISDMAAGYTNSNGATVNALSFPAGWAGAAGGIVSTVEDIAKWDQAFFSGQIVPMGDVTLATSVHRLPSGERTQYGFGWRIDAVDGVTRIHHAGQTAGFESDNQYFPSLHQTIIVLMNSHTGIEALGTAIFEALHPDLARRVQ